MDIATQNIIREAANGSSEGKLHFGQVLDLLTQAGVESYFADYRVRQTTYYLTSGECLCIELAMPEEGVTQKFNAEAIQAAIRGSQQGRIQYPEFKRLSQQAGCIGYIVWLTGRYVSYFGRKGETHIEHFPSAN